MPLVNGLEPFQGHTGSSFKVPSTFSLTVYGRQDNFRYPQSRNNVYGV